MNIRFFISAKHFVMRVMLALIMIITLLPITKVSAESQVDKVVNFALSMVGKSEYSGKCQAFVSRCYNEAGIYASKGTAALAYQTWCISSSISNIPRGAAVYFSDDNPAGHVGLYVGNNEFVHARASKGKICKNKLSESYYKRHYLGWGWNGGKALDGTDTNIPTITNCEDYYKLTAPDGFQTVRSSANSSSTSVGTIKAGTVVCITQYNSDKSWGYLSYNGISGWIRLYYVEKTTKPHTHYYESGYEAAHPHKVYMKCSCGDWYYTGETTKMDGCDLCYPIVHITLDANGGKNGTREFYYRANKSSYYSDMKLSNQITSIELPTREGYTFVAYGKYIFGCFRFDDMPDDYCSGDILPILSQEINSDTTLSALWAADYYELSYDLNGGYVSKENPTDYSIESEDFTLINPTKKGYQFIGWQENDSSITKMTITIPKGSTGNRSFKAIYYMPGDINGDGEVNTSDLVRLMKYMAGADVIAYYPDVNGDGIVATSDLIRLMKYISGADVTLYLSAPEPF